MWNRHSHQCVALSNLRSQQRVAPMTRHWPQHAVIHRLRHRLGYSILGREFVLHAADQLTTRAWSTPAARHLALVPVVARSARVSTTQTASRP